MRKSQKRKYEEVLGRLDETIAKELDKLEHDSIEMYDRRVEAISKLYESRAALMNAREDGKSLPLGISADVLVSGMFGLTSVWIITHYEQTNILTTKAIGFLKKWF